MNLVIVHLELSLQCFLLVVGLQEIHITTLLPHIPTWDIFTATNEILWQIAQPLFLSLLHPHSQVGQQQYVHYEEHATYGFWHVSNFGSNTTPPSSH
jgi:hypothetical protein